MKYVVIGGGGTGGMLAFALARGHKDVTLIARGAHLKAIQEKGLTVERTYIPSIDSVDLKATDMAHYDETPDVIFVCVKYYSLESCVSFINQVASPRTIVIPILNVFSTGTLLQSKCPDVLVTDGCIYISSYIKEPGVLLQNAPIFRIIFGVRNAHDYREELETVASDLRACGIDSYVSQDIQREALEKFSYVSPIGAAGVYLNATAGEFQKEGPARDLFAQMIKEVMNLAEAMGHPLSQDYVKVNLAILDTLSPETTTSMQRDIMADRLSEFDGLVLEIVRLGQQYHVDVSGYQKVAEALKNQVKY